MKANPLIWAFVLLITAATVQLQAQQNLQSVQNPYLDTTANTNHPAIQPAKQGFVAPLGDLGFVPDKVQTNQPAGQTPQWQPPADERVSKKFAETLTDAEKGDAVAQCVIAGYYAAGQEGVATNHPMAVNWLRKAAEQGYDVAQYWLGQIYFYDEGMRNLAEAEKWYLKAAEQGHIEAQTQVGLWKLLVEKDYTEAGRWLRKAAEKESPGAEYLFATMYMQGLGMEKDYVESAKWCQKAAEQGHIEAQTDLGAMYYNGQGLEKNYTEAYAWWNLAAMNSTNAANKRDILEKLITPEQIAEAQNRTKELRVLVEARKRNEQSQTDPFSTAQVRKSDPTGTGTGFFITDDGYLITNYHVVKDAVQVRLFTSAGLIDARVISVDTANDLALLKANIVPQGETGLPITASRTINLGDTVATVGFPDIGLQGYSPKFAKGEIAALSGAGDDPRYFQISVPVQPGNSGGALVDEHGNVVGIVAAKLSAKAALDASGQLPENVNYAVKSSLLLSFLESVPDVSANLKAPITREQKFDEVVRSAESASVLVLVY